MTNFNQNNSYVDAPDARIVLYDGLCDKRRRPKSDALPPSNHTSCSGAYYSMDYLLVGAKDIICNYNYPPSQKFHRRSGSRILQAVSVFLSKRSIRTANLNSDSTRWRNCISLAAPGFNSIWSQCVVTKMTLLRVLSAPTSFKIGLPGGLVQRLLSILWRNRRPATLEFL